MQHGRQVQKSEMITISITSITQNQKLTMICTIYNYVLVHCIV